MDPTAARGDLAGQQPRAAKTSR
ncbi:MAG: hypothetical protein RL026_1693, partial [Pseudomonadota bacterium]